MARKKRDLTSWIEAGKENLRRWKEENPDLAWQTNLRHGVYSKNIKSRYSDPNTPEGKYLQAILQAIEKDIGKPFDARQSLLLSLIRSKVVIITQIRKYLEIQESIVDYERGTVPFVINRTFFSASKSLRSALQELYETSSSKNRNQEIYQELVAEMKESQDG